MKINLFGLSLILASSASAYTLHEWGTFTSVSGSDGVLLSGLKREEERLPGFVHALDGMKNVGPMSAYMKGFIPGRPLRNVTIKMETPVIYFYSDKPFHAEVKVGFEGGSISQWYPQRAGGETPPPLNLAVKTTSSDLDEHFIKSGGIDFGDHKRGEISWELEVMDPDAPRSLSFKPDETMSWIRPRNSDANILKIGEEYEDYLFYRGVGNFDLPVTFTVDENETLKIKNTGSEKVPFLFVQEVTPDLKVRYFSMSEGLTAGSQSEIREEEFVETAQWQKVVYQEMANGLSETGLHEQEVNSMLQTWWHSYFQKPGLRVFWIVPNDETERILPLQVSPAPEKQVRVLVGRSEVLRPRFEKKLINLSQQKTPEGMGNWVRMQYDRYGLAYAERAQKLTAKKTSAP